MDEEARIKTKEIASKKLADASFVLGIISIFSVFFCCPFVISAIGITLALLSKGASEALSQKARTGLTLSIVGLFVSFFILVATIVMPIVLAKLNPAIGENFKKQYMEVLEENEDFYREMYGDEAFDTMEEIIENF